ncbi:MAG: hypothetical protein NC914_01865 [Candidatus Omnitrophica bacterium]|nr:hypothetical protein [Candidatus Omnitrophota bacterium]
MKKVILILIISNLTFFISTVSLGRQVYKNKTALAREMNLRFDLEVKEIEFNKMMKRMEQALEEEKRARQALAKELLEAREKLEKVTNFKEPAQQ